MFCCRDRTSIVLGVRGVSNPPNARTLCFGVSGEELKAFLNLVVEGVENCGGQFSSWSATDASRSSTSSTFCDFGADRLIGLCTRALEIGDSDSDASSKICGADLLAARFLG